jgi:hypothetical protein
MDFDPRDYDSRDDERLGDGRERGGLGEYRDRDDDDRKLPEVPIRDHDVEPRELGRGAGDDSRQSKGCEDSRDPRDDARWPDRDTREREVEPREVFARGLRLPRGPEREIVQQRDHQYTLRGSESRSLATVGAFRVVSSRDLRDYNGRTLDPRIGDLRHLREQGLVETRRIPGTRDHAVALTKEGRSVLESHRDHDRDGRQTFYAGLKRERELEHDVQVYGAHERHAERLNERGARIERIVLDHELKSQYQTWLHERDRDRRDYDGHPDRSDDEVLEWARVHDLPYFDDEVHFPDLRIEYQERDGSRDHDDIEVTTEHYRGAHAASVAKSGFCCYGGGSLRVGGRGGGGRGGAAFDPERRRR